MKVAVPSILIALLLGPIGIVQADLGLDRRLPVLAPVLFPRTVAPIVLRSPPAAHELREPQLEPLNRLGDPLEGGIVRTQGWATAGLAEPFPLTTQQPEIPGTIVRELPPAPGSGALFAAAMLSAGVWQALRKARNAQWGHLPDWYHRDGLPQVGHAVAYDLHSSPLTVCPFDEPVRAWIVLFRWGSNHAALRGDEWFFLPLIPRAPPLP